MKNKILVISIILLLLSCVFINNSFAVENKTHTITGINGTTFTFPDFSGTNIENGFFIQYWNGVYYMGVFNSNNVHLYINSTYKIGSTVSYTEYKLNTSSNSWDFYREMSANNEATTDGLLFYTTHDVYSSKTSNNINITKTGNNFFVPPPVVTLATVLEETNPTEMFKNLMKNVVVSLVVFLVGLVAFLKAWAWLKTQLHKA